MENDDSQKQEKLAPPEHRLRWIENALEETRAWVETEQTSSKGELMMSAPGSWDSAYNTDIVSMTRKAEETIIALEAERDHILRRRQRFDEENAAGKFDD